MKTFILSFDATRFIGQQKTLDALLQTHRLVSGWSSPFPGFYFVRSNSSALELRESLDDLFEKSDFIVSIVTKGNDSIDGRMTGEIWKWVNAKDDAQEVAK